MELGRTARNRIKIGTRASPLALAQAKEVAGRLAAYRGLPDDCFEIVPLTTRGDRLDERPLPEVGVKGLFTIELEERLVSGDLDLAVHSAKDVATTLPDGLHLSAFLPREDVRDVLISRSGYRLWELPPGAVVGTSSIRRAALVAMHRPDLDVVPFRGFVGTRLKKLENGVVDATLLAMAGLNRLGMSDAATEILNPHDFPPSPAQGAICIESVVANDRITDLVSALNDAGTADAVRCERAFLQTLNGSCRTPIGALAVCHGSEILLRGLSIDADGRNPRRVAVRGARTAPAALGEEAGQMALAGVGMESEPV